MIHGCYSACLPVSQLLVQFDYDFIFFLSEAVTVNIRPLVIPPTESTTLPTSQQTYKMKRELKKLIKENINFLCGKKKDIHIT